MKASNRHERQSVSPRSRVCLMIIFALVVGGPVAQASAASLKGPKRVTPGKNATFRASGFGADKQINLTLQPTVNRDGNGFGIRIKKRFKTNANGKATLRFKWPSRYNACAGGSGPCTKRKWKRGSRADANACGDLRNRNYSCARKVVRIAKASATAAARTRRCGNLVFTPQSGDVLGSIRARGISCKRARSKLRAWRRNSYRPSSGPRGYRCRGGGPGKRSTCRRKGRRVPVISFISGT